MTAGDRTIEWGWCCAHLAFNNKRVRVLDFGGGEGMIAATAAMIGRKVDYVDLGRCCFEHPNLYAFAGDYRQMPDRGLYDYIACCSTIEHVGLGRYGDKIEAEGDLLAMEWLKHKLQPDGQLALTIPIGIDAVCGEMHRIYGKNRLPTLMFGFTTLAVQAWMNVNGVWTKTPEIACLNAPGSETQWCLGLYLLQKS